MDIQNIKKLVRLLEHSGVDEIEVEEEGIRIRIARNMRNNSAQHGQIVEAQAPPVAPQSAVPAKPEITHHEVKSPIVGTFYRAPAPDADPYVEVGQAIQAKTVLCIIEAMKLMNEIESDVAGRVVKIMVENGQPVEYNQTLFLIEPM
jgi:acetyl-CoA carboxylase biotin carboxyl carrier protein